MISQEILNSGILERLEKLEHSILCHKKILTFDETAIYMGVSKSYLYKLTSKNLISHSLPLVNLFTSKDNLLKIGC